jgi:hypothetical protein
MLAQQKTVFRNALMQIWETVYDHDMSKYSGTDSKQQRQAAFDNIELLERLLADEPVH